MQRYRHRLARVPGRLAVVCVAAIVLGGCSLPRVPVRPPPGLLVTWVKAPLTTDFDSAPVGPRNGTSSSFYFREPFFGTTWAFGDASLEAAARSGRIETVHFADYQMVQVLGLVGHFEVTANGD